MRNPGSVGCWDALQSVAVFPSDRPAVEHSQGYRELGGEGGVSERGAG